MKYTLTLAEAETGIVIDNFELDEKVAEPYHDVLELEVVDKIIASITANENLRKDMKS